MMIENKGDQTGLYSMFRTTLVDNYPPKPRNGQLNLCSFKKGGKNVGFSPTCNPEVHPVILEKLYSTLFLTGFQVNIPY